jgi:hypothetical protein
MEFWFTVDNTVDNTAPQEFLDQHLAQQLAQWQGFYNQERTHSAILSKTPNARFQQLIPVLPTFEALQAPYTPPLKKYITNNHFYWAMPDTLLSKHPLCNPYIIGMFVGFQMNVRLGYDNDGLGLQGWVSKWGPNMVGNNVNTMLSKVQPADPIAWISMTLDGLFTYALKFARSILLWFPLHPLGYLMSFTLPLYHL